MKRILLLGIAGIFLLACASPAVADRLPENPLVSCGDCRDHGPGLDEAVVDGNGGGANFQPRRELIAPEPHQWLTRIALRLVLLASLR